MLEAALELANHGWTVFPCIPRGPKAKAPLTKAGHLDASRDPEAIRQWWQRWPDAMIGAAVHPGLLVLDIDPRNGGSLEALEVLTGPLPETLTVWSGRGDGGRHLYWQRPAGELTQTNLPAGIDLKWHGYTILPPSIHPASGKAYLWEVRPVAALPARLRGLLLAPQPWAKLVKPAPGQGEPLVRLVLDLKDGERNRGLFWAACRAAESGRLSPSLTAQLVLAAENVGLTAEEATRTIESARRKAGRA